jgi:hypothetical protein
MKKQFFRMASLRRTGSRFLVTVCIVVSALAANAQVSQVKQSINATPVSVKYIGTSDEQMAFAVHYDNYNGDKFDITVRDNEGSLLYRNSFTNKTFNKTFMLPKGNEKVTFIIKNLKTNEVNSFEANMRVVEQVLVRKS